MKDDLSKQTQKKTKVKVVKKEIVIDKNLRKGVGVNNQCYWPAEWLKR